MDKDLITRFICFAVGCYFVFQVLLYLLPYVILFCAILGAGYLYTEYQRNKWKNRR